MLKANNKKRFLIMAPLNQPVDVAAAAIHDVMKDDEGLKDLLVV
jgi:hypothetical protein